MFWSCRISNTTIRFSQVFDNAVNEFLRGLGQAAVLSLSIAAQRCRTSRTNLEQGLKSAACSTEDQNAMLPRAFHSRPVVLRSLQSLIEFDLPALA